MTIKSVNFKKYNQQHENLSKYLVNQKDTGMVSVKFKNNKPYIILREDIMSDFYLILNGDKYPFHTKIKKQNVTIIFSTPIPGNFLDILNGDKVVKQPEYPVVKTYSPVIKTEKDTPPGSPPTIIKEIYHHIDNTGLTSYSDEYPESRKSKSPRQTMSNLKKRAHSIIQERKNQHSGPLSPFQKTLDVDTGGLYKHFDANFDEYKTLILKKGKGSVKQICDWNNNKRNKSLDPLNNPTPNIVPPNLPIREGDIATPNTVCNSCHIEYTQGEHPTWCYYCTSAPKAPKGDSITILPNTVCDNCHIEYIQSIYPTCPYCTILPISKYEYMNNLPSDESNVHICRKCCIAYPSSYKICPYYPRHITETGSSKCSPPSPSKCSSPGSSKCSSPGSSKCSSESDFVIVESL